MHYNFNAPAGAGVANEIIILVIFLVAVFRIVMMSARKKVEFDQSQENREQYKRPEIEPVAGYQPREARPGPPMPPKRDNSLSQRISSPLETSLEKELREAALKQATPKSEKPHGLIRRPREAASAKTDSEKAYLIRDRHGSRLNMDPAALRKMIIAKELLDRPVSMREKRGYRLTR
jgi:hypothetical protein